MSELLCLGVSHKTAPVALRERLAMGDRRAIELLRACVRAASIDEAAVVSTCNRTEVYVATSSAAAAEDAVLALLAERAGAAPDEVAAVAYAPRDCDAARHLYRVTAGLESMIVGEAEIQGQVRHAHALAREAHTAGPTLNRLFGAALRAGRRVRSETRISEGRASVASVAVQLAREVLGDLRSRHVVIVGAGETGELTARALAEQGVATVFLANRRADRARSIAERYGGDVVPLHDLPAQLARADIVVTATASPHTIVGADALGQVVAERDGRPLLLIDIAVPRDVDPACGALDGVTLYDIDDLQTIVSHALRTRAAEAVAAEEVIEQEIGRFAEWLGQRDVRPTVAALRRLGDEIVDQVLAENAGRWEGATERDLARVEAVARAVMRRLLHEPTIRLREGGHGHVALARELFGIDAAADAPPAAEEPARDNVHRLRADAAG